jgi:hypothetical protein
VSVGEFDSVFVAEAWSFVEGAFTVYCCCHSSTVGGH